MRFSGHRNQQVSRVTYVKMSFQLMFYELVKLVEVNIGEELRCKISERHAFALIFIFIILEYFFDEKYSITIFYFLSDD